MGRGSSGGGGKPGGGGGGAASPVTAIGPRQIMDVLIQNFQPNVRVTLADLANKLGVKNITEVQDTLFQLQSQGRIALYRADEPPVFRGSGVNQNVITTSTGQERHYLYFGPDA